MHSKLVTTRKDRSWIDTMRFWDCAECLPPTWSQLVEPDYLRVLAPLKSCNSSRLFGVNFTTNNNPNPWSSSSIITHLNFPFRINPTQISITGTPTTNGTITLINQSHTSWRTTNILHQYTFTNPTPLWSLNIENPLWNTPHFTLHPKPLLKSTKTHLYLALHTYTYETRQAKSPGWYDEEQEDGYYFLTVMKVEVGTGRVVGEPRHFEEFVRERVYWWYDYWEYVEMFVLPGRDVDGGNSGDSNVTTVAADHDRLVVVGPQWDEYGDGPKGTRVVTVLVPHANISETTFSLEIRPYRNMSGVPERGWFMEGMGSVDIGGI
ncbi:hypothetical protein HDV00_010712 [Rhizophlyctis rosea]|nr:hypothetical protein HDV00_010712 [Rhizophlyctis rosea]